MVAEHQEMKSEKRALRIRPRRDFEGGPVVTLCGCLGLNRLADVGGNVDDIGSFPISGLVARELRIECEGKTQVVPVGIESSFIIYNRNNTRVKQTLNSNH